MVGKAIVQLTSEGRSCKQPIYVIKDLKNNLLGLPAIAALQLLTKVDSIQSGNIQQSFPKLFQGLGTLKGDYQIQLKPDAKPYALYTARCANVSSTPGNGCVSLRTLLLRGFKSTQILTSPDFLWTTTIPAHKRVGLSTLDITPIFSICLTFPRRGIGTFLCNVRDRD